MRTLKGDKANKLEYAMQGRGAFRRFKDAVNHMGIEQQWYGFQAEYYKKLAVDWCRDHKVEYIN